MSTLVKCPKGHYYDPEKYSSCPHCADGERNAANEMTATIPQQWSNDISVTVPATDDFSNKVEDDLDKTVGMAVWNGERHEGEGLEEAIMPVVGWLVCKKGSEFGKSFTLKAGRNFIGRSDENDVVIKGDKGISRKEHGIIVYDPKSRKFHVQPGSSSELFYINGDVVLQVAELKNKDIITLSETELIFVAFCGDDFAWEEM